MKSLPYNLVIIILIISGVTSNSLLAQKKLEGYLKDIATDEPVAFAHLEVKGKTKIGTVSNEDGYFKLDAEGLTNSDTLLITHINYLPYILPLMTFQEQVILKISLIENIIQLNEIQVLPTEDYQTFEKIVSETKKNLHFPMTANIYYRELAG